MCVLGEGGSTVCTQHIFSVCKAYDNQPGSKPSQPPPHAYSTIPSAPTHPYLPVVDDDVCDDLDVVLVALDNQLTQLVLTAVAAVELVQVTREVALWIKGGSAGVRRTENDWA